MRVPVAVCVFNRPDLTEQVLRAVAAADPPLVFAIADAPRDSRDETPCRQTRELFADLLPRAEVRWNCAPENMGPDRRIPSGLDWVFEHVGRAVVLEDDCVPEASFFPFVEEVLDRFADDERVWSVTGLALSGPSSDGSSYHFSRYPSSWGWATWKSAWKRFSVRMDDWPRLRTERRFSRIFRDPSERHYWRYMLDRLASGELEAWDYHWAYRSFIAGGLHVRSSDNLIRNVGFRSDATHTTDASNPLASLATSPITFPLNHPSRVERDEVRDRRMFRRYYRKPVPQTIEPGFVQRLWGRLARIGRPKPG